MGDVVEGCAEEKVEIRMCKAAKMYEPTSPQISGMWTALGVAREGYWSQEDVEKAILAQARGFQVIPVDELAEFLKQALAPKPSLTKRMTVILTREQKRAAWKEFRPVINAIGEISVQEAMDAIERSL